MDRRIQDEGPKWLWGCCNCRESSIQTGFIPSCPGCQHGRCTRCPWEPVPIAVQETQFDRAKGHDPSINSEIIASIKPSPSLPSLVNAHDTSRAPSLVQNLELQRKGGKKVQSASKLKDPARSFACHFYKRSPEIYNPWSGGDKWLKCLYPDPSEIRHIHDNGHLKIHKLPYFRCQQCYATFTNEIDLSQHKKSSFDCSMKCFPKSDGIDLNQWKQIGDTISPKKNRDKSPEQRWFEIWDMLFPGVPRPDSPYSQPPKIDATSFLTYIEYNAELNYDTGNLQRDEHCHRVWMDSIEQALESSVGVCQGIGMENATPQSLLNEGMTESVLQSYSQGSEVEGKVLMGLDGKRPFDDDRLKPTAFTERGINDSLHTNLFMDTLELEPPTLNEKCPTRKRLRPLAAAKPSTVHDLGKHRSSNDSASQLKPDPNPGDMSASTSHINQSINDAWPDLEDLSTETQGTILGSHEIDTQGTDPFQLPLESYGCDTSFSVPEERAANATNYPPNFGSMEEMLSFESTLPGANAPLEDYRDMNKGLQGRYEFDHSM